MILQKYMKSTLNLNLNFNYIDTNHCITVFNQPITFQLNLIIFLLIFEIYFWLYGEIAQVNKVIDDFPEGVCLLSSSTVLATDWRQRSQHKEDVLLVTNDGMKSRFLVACLVARHSIRDSLAINAGRVSSSSSSLIIDAIDASTSQKERDDPE